jgi:hypothetical protein
MECHGNIKKKNNARGSVIFENERRQVSEVSKNQAIISIQGDYRYRSSKKKFEKNIKYVLRLFAVNLKFYMEIFKSMIVGAFFIAEIQFKLEMNIL